MTAAAVYSIKDILQSPEIGIAYPPHDLNHLTQPKEPAPKTVKESESFHQQLEKESQRGNKGRETEAVDHGEKPKPKSSESTRENSGKANQSNPETSENPGQEQATTKKQALTVSGNRINAGLLDNRSAKIRQLFKNAGLEGLESEKVPEQIKDNFSNTKIINTIKNMENFTLEQLGSNPKQASQNLPGSGEVNTKLLDLSFEAMDTSTDHKTGKDTRTGPEVEIQGKMENLAPQNDSILDKQKNIPLKEAIIDHFPKVFIETNGKEIKTGNVFTQQRLLEQLQEFQTKIINNVEKSIKFLYTGSENKINIKLHPPELGKIQVELLFKGDQVEAKIQTENHAVKEVILTHLEQLKSNLENVGLNINKFDVSVGDFKNQFYKEYSGQPNNKGTGTSVGNQPAHDASALEPDKIVRSAPLTLFIGKRLNVLV